MPPYLPSETAPKVVSSPVRTGPESILIVEDDEELLALTSITLVEAGYSISNACTAAECRRMVAESKPDLILLDINLPDESGFNLCFEFKSTPATAGIAILHLSGDYISSEEQACGLDAGADGYITRPIGSRELIARVQAMLRMRRTEAELRRVTEELRVTSRAMQQMMNCSLDAICSIDEDGYFSEVSAAAERMWGFSREELIGRKCLDLVHRGDVERSEAELESIMAGRETRDFENRFIRKDGGVVMLSWSAYWSTADRTMYCVARDVTEGRITERALQRMGQRLQGTLESMTDAFYLLDREWYFTYLNGEAERLMKRPREDLVYRNIWDEFPAFADSEMFAQFHRCYAENRPAHFEFYIRGFDRWIQVHAFPSEEGLAVYFRDTTERRRKDDMLRDSHERFLNVVRATNHVMWDWDFAKNEIWWADGFENRLGHNTSQIDPKGRFWFEHIHPEDKDRVYQGLRNCIESGLRVWSDEYRFRRGDGTYAYVHDRGYIMHDADGKPVRAVGGMIDISARHEQESLLRESEARFRQLADNVEDAFWIIDAATHQPVYVNPAFRRMCGSSADGPLAVDAFMNSIHPADRDRVSLHGFDRRDGFNGEYRMLRPDGSTIWVWARMVPVRDTDGTLIRIVGIARDITHRKKADELICEQAALLDNAQEAIFVVDLEGDVLFWNRSAERLYGPCSAEIIGRPFSPVPAGKGDAHLAARRRVIEHGDWIGELHEQTLAGRQIVVEGHWTLVRDTDGAPRSILCINTDITERKRLETQVLRAQRLESIGTLAGGIAHDLNNILTPIIMSIDLLKRFCPEEDLKDILDTIDTSAHRGADMVRQVLSFARGIEGERIAIQPRHLLKEIHKIVADTFPKNIDLKIIIKPGLWSVVGDPTQLHQVLLNLCVNARDAMPSGGCVTITVSNVMIDENYAAMNLDARLGAHVLIEVQDTGIGMPPEVLDKIFDPFFTTKEVGKGTGLGLSTSLAIVKSHGGFLRVYSEVGRGAHFSLHLPASPDADCEELVANDRKLLAGKGELILLVDDELPIRTVAKQTLSAFGYRVLVASDGAEAVAMYAQRQNEIALVLTDMMMPIMDGAATIEVLIRMNPEVKIIAASGMTANCSLAKVNCPNVKLSLTKPYTTETMLEALAEVLGRKQPGPGRR